MNENERVNELLKVAAARSSASGELRSLSDLFDEAQDEIEEAER